MLSAAIERAGLTDPSKVAYALEGLRIKTGMGETSLRPENHQLLEPLYMLSKVNADGVAEKYNVENTGIGIKTDGRVGVKAQLLPTQYRMIRLPKT